MYLSAIRLIMITSLSMLMILPVANAQEDENSPYEIAYQAREAERRAIIAFNLELSDRESKAFWPLYKKYRSNSKIKEKLRIKLLKKFAKNMKIMSKKDAERIVMSALNLEADRERLKKDYILSLKYILIRKKFFRYYQIETKLDAIYKFQWTKAIPLATANKKD